MKKIFLFIPFLFTIINCAQSNTRNEATERQQEFLYVNLPDKNNWKITNEGYENNKRIILAEQFKDSIEQPAAYLAITSAMGITTTDLEKEMKEYFKTAKDKSGNATLTVIEKNTKAVAPYILFFVENMYNEERKRKESIICMYLQGKQSFHTCSVSMAEIAFTNEQIAQKASMLKTCRTVYK